MQTGCGTNRLATKITDLTDLSRATKRVAWDEDLMSLFVEYADRVTAAVAGEESGLGYTTVNRFQRDEWKRIYPSTRNAIITTLQRAGWLPEGFRKGHPVPPSPKAESEPNVPDWREIADYPGAAGEELCRYFRLMAASEKVRVAVPHVTFEDLAGMLRALAEEQTLDADSRERVDELCETLLGLHAEETAGEGPENSEVRNAKRGRPHEAGTEPR